MTYPISAGPASIEKPPDASGMVEMARSRWAVAIVLGLATTALLATVAIQNMEVRAATRERQSLPPRDGYPVLAAVAQLRGNWRPGVARRRPCGRA